MTFEKWGLPKAIRVDNGSPWATQSDVPSALHLCLLGFGVRVLFIPPRQSTANGVVERDHGVLADWCEAERARTVADLQQRIDWCIHMQRERYPAVRGQSRLNAYPTLLTNPRTYTVAQETSLWQIERVYSYLSEQLWQRRVDKVGRISFFSHAYSVGRPYAGQTVTVRFNPDTQAWVIESEQGTVLKRYPAREITLDCIFAFNMTQRANYVSH